jgi:hypothetical protein
MSDTELEQVFRQAERSFRRELQAIVNRYSRENGSNTPDFILAEYLNTCLTAFDEAVNAREKWYGRPK